MNLFQLSKVSKEHFLGSVKLRSLQQIDLNIEKGKITSFLGPEASGKSRILHLLSLNDTPTEGELIYKGRNLRNFDEKQLSRIRTFEVGMVPQSFHLNSTVSILENVSMVSKIMGEDNWMAQEKAEFWLNKMGLFHNANDYPIELGLLEFKKVGIAKAMIKKPDFLIVDELYASLNEQECNDLFNILYNLNKEYNLTIVQATRRLSYCRYSDVIFQMNNGKCHLQKSDEATAA